MKLALIVRTVALWLIPLLCHAVTPMVTASRANSLFLRGDGSVWGTGQVPNYRMGATSPVQLAQLPDTVAVASDGYAVFELLGNGTIWASGQNDHHQLADGTTDFRLQPQQIAGLTDVIALSASENFHYLALKNDGTVRAWGENSSGQLGDGTQTNRYVPVPVVGLTNITRVSAGYGTSLALKSDGTVWVWGNTCCGQAGNGVTDRQSNHLIPMQVLNLDRVVAIAAGGKHHLVLRDDGSVWAWGTGDMGQNGTGKLTSERLPVQVAALQDVVAIGVNSTQSAFALKSDGTVWAWGSNSVGLLGVSSITYSALPIQVQGLSGIASISVGMTHVLAVRDDGAVYAWGTNVNGELGDRTLRDRIEPRLVVGPGGNAEFNILKPVPTAFNRLPEGQIDLSVDAGSAPLSVTASAVRASDPDGTVAAYHWKSSNGEVAVGPSAVFTYVQAGSYTVDLLIEDNTGATGHVVRPIVVSPPAAVAIAAIPKLGIGVSSSVALANDGRILTWGARWSLGWYDFVASLALPDLNSVPTANGITGASDISVGGGATHVLIADGNVLGWGYNSNGTVGSRSTMADIDVPQLIPNLPPVKNLAAGGLHRLALGRDGRVFSWGGNGVGQLGLGDYEVRFQPAEVQGLASIDAIAAGFGFSAALKADGSVWAWGDNSDYALGDGSTISRNRPAQVAGLVNISRIFTSAAALYAQERDGTVWVTGRTPFGSSVYGDPGPQAGVRRLPVLDGAVQISGARTHILVLKANGSVLSGGFRQDPARGIPSGGDIAGLMLLPGVSDVIWVTTSDDNSAVLRRDGTVLIWGANGYGQIGDGTLAMQSTPVFVVNESSSDFLDLIPETPNTIPRDKIPPFLAATYATGGLTSKTLYADVRGVSPRAGFASTSSYGGFASGYNVYVAASVPVRGESVVFQLDPSNGWRSFTWPMSEFLRGVALESQAATVRARILQDADLSGLSGAEIIVGYGTDPDEMLQNARYRTIFTVPAQ